MGGKGYKMREEIRKIKSPKFIRKTRVKIGDEDGSMQTSKTHSILKVLSGNRCKALLICCDIFRHREVLLGDN